MGDLDNDQPGTADKKKEEGHAVQKGIKVSKPEGAVTTIN